MAKSAPRTAQERPRTTQELPGVAQERPRVPQERPKSGQELPKSAPREAKIGPRTAQDRPKSGQEHPKGDPRAATSAQERPKRGQERPKHSKTAQQDPKRLQEQCSFIFPTEKLLGTPLFSLPAHDITRMRVVRRMYIYLIMRTPQEPCVARNTIAFAAVCCAMRRPLLRDPFPNREERLAALGHTLNSCILDSLGPFLSLVR